jgi:hypothetical protein
MNMLDYYATPKVRSLCHRVKKGEDAALRQVAEVMAVDINENDTITPVPNRHGEAGLMGLVCKYISDITGCQVWDGIVGAQRQSQYAAKKNGQSLSPSELGFALSSPIPAVTDRHFVIDAIKDTGTTLRAALSLLPGSESMTFASVDKGAEREALRILGNLPDTSVQSVTAGLYKATKDNVAFAYAYEALKQFPEVEEDLIRQLKKQFNYTQHAGIKEGCSQGFISVFNIKKTPPISPLPTKAKAEEDFVRTRTIKR